LFYYFSLSAKLKVVLKADQINTPHLHSWPPKYSIGYINLLVNTIDPYDFFKDAVLTYQYHYMNNYITLHSNKAVIKFSKVGNFQVTVNVNATMKTSSRIFYASSYIVIDVRGMYIPVGKIAKKQSERIWHSNYSTDCFFGDFTYWDGIYNIYNLTIWRHGESK